MPPRIPVCVPRAPHPAANGLRGFSSTSRSAALGPQSPNYIDVPKPLQPSYAPKPIVKGHLPVPRDIFKNRSAIPKASPRFIDNVTRDAREIKQPGPFSKDAEQRLYKQRLSERRKAALRQGVKELHARKVKMDAERFAYIQKSGADRVAYATAPPRQVDVLTQNSVSKGIRDLLDNKLPSTTRANIPKARRIAYAKRMSKQDATRQARLHELYTNAREFIVNEEQLDEAIEKAFGNVEEPMGWDNKGTSVPNGPSPSPWSGPIPEGVSDRLQKLKGGEGVGLAEERIRKVAEELTGGKM